MPGHQRLVPAIIALVLLVASILPTPAVEANSTRLYVGHAARLTASIPVEWTFDATGESHYLGNDGYVVSGPVEGETLQHACTDAARLTGGVVTETTWSGEAACQVDGRLLSHDIRGLIVPHPHPFVLQGQHYAFAMLATDPNHFDSIAATLSFDPGRVTPETYLTSAIDMAEALAWWGEEIDWEWARKELLASIEGLTTIESIHGAILELVNKLRAVGDNHSFVLLPDQANALQETSGFGMYVGGNHVIAVYPGGPAAEAGIEAGDVIVSLNGSPPPYSTGLDPWRSWTSPATLTVRREGIAEPATVTIATAKYELYLPPTGRALTDAIGYIDIPLFRVAGREAEFATSANEVIAELDQTSNCGWIVDLRLNLGGSYSPMVTGIGPLLGDGPFVGWLSGNDRQSWVTYEDGVITDNGREVSNHLADENRHDLLHPNPPVAVLTSAYTGSSGEVTTLAFVGRPDTRLFGEQTGGLTTANQGFFLFDGTWLVLATAAMTDRTGHTHLAGVVPDELVPIDWDTYGTGDDPVIAAAQEWLQQHPSCIDATPQA
jgi:C-terminal processing protease CtpA/Prc